MIGGEFHIPFTDLINNPGLTRVDKGTYHYASGRASLYQILKYLKEQRGITEVLLPDYLCNSILIPVKKLDFHYGFYPLNNELKLEIQSFHKAYNNETAVLLINYYGLQDLSEQIAIVRSLNKNAIIIEDDVQAYFEFKKPLGDVDFKYTSLRKTFAIPDGGLVKTEYPMPIINEPNTFGQYKTAAALMKAMREGIFDDDVYLNISRIGNGLIDNELDCGMSLISEHLYACLDEEKVKRRRQENAKYLAKLLFEKGISTILPMNDDHVPLFVPIYLINRDDVRRRMFQHEVYCPIHWPIDGLSVRTGIDMAEHELSLIVDQRYNESNLKYMVSLI